MFAQSIEKYKYISIQSEDSYPPELLTHPLSNSRYVWVDDFPSSPGGIC